MNKLVKDQLNKVTEADLSKYDSSSNTFYIPQKTQIKLQENSVYVIKLLPGIFSNDILCSNWNNNTYPPSTYLKADINKIMVNMIKINCIALDDNLCDTDIIWEGWLPIDNIEIVEKL